MGQFWGKSSHKLQFFTMKPQKILPTVQFLLNSRISLLNSMVRKFCCAFCLKIGEKPA